MAAYACSMRLALRRRNSRPMCTRVVTERMFGSRLSAAGNKPIQSSIRSSAARIRTWEKSRLEEERDVFDRPILDVKTLRDEGPTFRERERRASEAANAAVTCDYM